LPTLRDSSLRELLAVRHDRVGERLQEPRALRSAAVLPQGAVERGRARPRRRGRCPPRRPMAAAGPAARRSPARAGSRISPDAGSTISPPMKSPYSCPAVTAIGRNLAGLSTPARCGRFRIRNTPREETRCRARSVWRLHVSQTATGLLEALRNEGLGRRAGGRGRHRRPRRRGAATSSSTRSKASSSAWGAAVRARSSTRA